MLRAGRDLQQHTCLPVNLNLFTTIPDSKLTQRPSLILLQGKCASKLHRMCPLKSYRNTTACITTTNKYNRGMLYS